MLGAGDTNSFSVTGSGYIPYGEYNFGALSGNIRNTPNIYLTAENAQDIMDWAIKEFGDKVAKDYFGLENLNKIEPEEVIADKNNIVVNVSPRIRGLRPNDIIADDYESSQDIPHLGYNE